MRSQSKLLCSPMLELRCWNLKDYIATDIYCLALDRKWLANPDTATLGILEGSMGYFLWLPILSLVPDAWSTPNVATEEGHASSSVVISQKCVWIAQMNTHTLDDLLSAL